MQENGLLKPKNRKYAHRRKVMIEELKNPIKFGQAILSMGILQVAMKHFTLSIIKIYSRGKLLVVMLAII